MVVKGVLLALSLVCLGSVQAQIPIQLRGQLADANLTTSDARLISGSVSALGVEAADISPSDLAVVRYYFLAGCFPGSGYRCLVVPSRCNTKELSA